MTDSCLICQTEAISLDDWYLKISEDYLNIAKQRIPITISQFTTTDYL